MQHNVTQYNTLQQGTPALQQHARAAKEAEEQGVAVSHCNKMQRTTTHYNTLQHTATHCNVLHDTAVKEVEG